jgi:hypothetical protein
MEYTKEFLKAFERIANVETTTVKYSPIVISTMTLSGKYDKSDIPIGLIRERLEEDERDLYIAIPKIVKHRTKTVASKNKFDHQVTIHSGTSSVKIFSNGSIHGTGIGSIEDFIDLADDIASYIFEISGIKIDLVEHKINMISVATSIVDSKNNPVTFRMKQLEDAFVRAGIHAEFDVERHPAVKIILYDGDGTKASTSFVFPTGSITVFVSKTPENIAIALEKLITVMNDVESSRCIPRKTTVKKSLDISFGYNTSIVSLLKTLL